MVVWLKGEVLFLCYFCAIFVLFWGRRSVTPTTFY